VIIHKFDVERVAFFPHETDAPLIVDPNAMLPLSVAFQLFQPVARRTDQIPQLPRGVDHLEFCGEQRAR